MTAVSLSAIVLAFLGTVPGQTTGWGTGPVQFRAYVNTAEHQEIYPVCAGEYTVQATIADVLDDPGGLLENKTSINICYSTRMDLKVGDTIEVQGIYYDGVSPIPYYGRVQASSIYRVDPEQDSQEEGDGPEDIWSPWVLTGAADATETTVTLQGTIVDDGGESCRGRFVYHKYNERSWTTEWMEGLGRSTVSQKIAGLAPGTLYFYLFEAENSAGRNTGREGIFVTLQEKVPPVAHPAGWLTAPNQGGTALITMTADVERDITGPVEYFFDFVASLTGGAGGSDSLWQFNPLYQDVGLNPNQQYGYRVKARDGNGNETAYSSIEYAYTDIETPAGITFGPLTPSSVQAKASGVLSGLSRGQSGLKLENVTAGQLSDWQRDNTFWTSTGLLPNTRYVFRARARNGDGDPTPFGPEAAIYTQAVAPTPVVISSVTVSQIHTQWGPNGNPATTQYWCQNTVSGANSGWTTGVQWLETGLSPNVRYAYRVKARNGDNVETALSAAVQCYTAIETPTGIAFGTITPTSIQVRSQNVPSGLDRGEAGLLFENVTASQVSPWRHDNSFWTSDGLLPNQRYGFRVRARNGDGVQTPCSETLYLSTQANVPAPAGFAAVSLAGIQVQWSANGNPPGTLYLCENTTAGTNSAWTTRTAWDDSGLAPNTVYAYRVKARNADGVETAWASLGTQSTDYRTLTLSSTPGGRVTTPAQSVVRYAPGAIAGVAAVPTPGYHFLCWTGSAVDAGRVADPRAAQTTVLVDAHYTLVANFLRTKIFVDKRATGAKDGSTWTNAFTSLQDALDLARTGNQIWVAQGTYRPDVGQKVLPGDQLATFELKSGVAIKGGYAGLGSADPNQRDIARYETILSGDLKGDDSAVLTSYDLYLPTKQADNSLHVVSAWGVDDQTLLEGVTITGGNGPDGSGLSLVRSQLHVTDCLIRANRAGELSGDGRDGWGQGAGVSCYQADPVFVGCVFLSNWAGGQGAGLSSVESRPTLTGCLFQDNQAGLQGGGLYTQDSNQVCVNCTFQHNWATDGGAIYSDEGCTSRITGGRFFGNAAYHSGGAVLDAGRGLEMTDCLFSGNLAYADGGAVFLYRDSGVLINCTFNRNLGANKQGGQALAVSQTTVVLTNCILWDNAGNAQPLVVLTGTGTDPAQLLVSNCDVLAGEGGILPKGTATVTWGAGNLSLDPRFRNPAGPDQVAGTEDDDLRLGAGSPAIDAGDNIAVPTDLDDLDADGNRLERLPVDLDGRSRFVNDPATPDTGTADAPLYPAVVDLGAYEFGGS